MVQNEGSPALMLTVSPNDQGSLAISYLAGGIKNTLSDGKEIKLEELYLLPEGQLPTQPQRLALLAGDPTAPQRFFDRQVHLLLEHFLGWDVVAGKCKKEGGFFGHVKAFYGLTEAAMRGSLHLHLLIWLHKWPAFSLDVKDMLKQQQCMDAIIHWIDSVLSANLPIDLGCSACSHCSSKGYVSNPSVDLVQMRMRPKLEPYLLRCKNPNCTAVSRCSDAQLRAVLQYVNDNSLAEWYGPPDQPHINRLVEKELAAAVPSARQAFSTAERALLDTRLALRCNLHNWRHHESCFKKGTPVCRYRVPHCPVEKSGFDPEGALVVQRCPGSEYLTPFISLLLRILRCNHDLRILLSDDGVDAVFYVVKYVCKKQHNSDLIGSLAKVALRNAEKKEQATLLATGDPLPLEKRVRSRLAGLLYHITRYLEIPIQLALHLLMRGTPAYCSHNFRTLLLTQFLAWVGRSYVSATVTRVPGSSNFVLVNDIMDWMYRPAALANVSLFEFYKKYKKIRKPQPKKARSLQAALASEAAHLAPEVPDDGEDEEEEQDDEARPEEDEDDDGHERDRGAPRRKRARTSLDESAAMEVDEDERSGDLDDFEELVEGPRGPASAVLTPQGPASAEGTSPAAPAPARSLATAGRRKKAAAEKFEFLPGHPQATTHHLQRATANLVVDVIGPRLPDFGAALASLTASPPALATEKKDALDKIDLFCRSVLVLFSEVGWRHPEQLVPAGTTFTSYFVHHFYPALLAQKAPTETVAFATSVGRLFPTLDSPSASPAAAAAAAVAATRGALPTAPTAEVYLRPIRDATAAFGYIQQALDYYEVKKRSRARQKRQLEEERLHLDRANNVDFDPLLDNVNQAHSEALANIDTQLELEHPDACRQSRAPRAEVPAALLNRLTTSAAASLQEDDFKHILQQCASLPADLTLSDLKTAARNVEVAAENRLEQQTLPAATEDQPATPMPYKPASLEELNAATANLICREKPTLSASESQLLALRPDDRVAHLLSSPLTDGLRRPLPRLIAAAAGLNQRQYDAFALMADGLLHSFKDGPNNPLRMYLGGKNTLG
jgi:hypothetical protein